MEDIYCDFDYVLDAIFDMVDSNDKSELILTMENVNVGLIEEGGCEALGEFIEVFSDDIDVIRSDYCKVIFGYLGVFVVLYYSVNLNITTFVARTFYSIEDADELYISL